MKIEDRTSPKEVRFCDVSCGDVFTSDRCVFIKTAPFAERMNAFNISRVEKCEFQERDMVRRVNATLVIE